MLADSNETDDLIDFLGELDEEDAKTGIKANREQLKIVSASIDQIIVDQGSHITHRFRSDLLALTKTLNKVKTVDDVKKLANALYQVEYGSNGLEPLLPFRRYYQWPRTALEIRLRDAFRSQLPSDRVYEDTKLLIVYGQHDSNFICNVTADFLATEKWQEESPNTIETHWATIKETLQKTFGAHENTKVMLIPGGHNILRPESDEMYHNTSAEGVKCTECDWTGPNQDAKQGIILLFCPKCDNLVLPKSRQEGFEEMMKLMRE